MPKTCAIDRDGVIRWAFTDTDYTKRAEPAGVFAALDALRWPAATPCCSPTRHIGSDAAPPP